MEDELTFEECIQKALLKAQDAFEKELEDNCFDPAYTDIRFTAWVLDDSFEARLRRFEIEGECKDNNEDI
jgi:hypothetical protein